MDRRNFLKVAGFALPLVVVAPGISAEDIKITAEIDKTGDFVNILLKAHYKERVLYIRSVLSRVHLINDTGEIQAHSSMLRELASAFKQSVDSGATQEHIDKMFNKVTPTSDATDKNEDWFEDFGYSYGAFKQAKNMELIYSERGYWKDGG